MKVFFKRTEESSWEPLRCHLSGRLEMDSYEACYRGRHLMRHENCWEVRVVDDRGHEEARFYLNENGAVTQDGGVDL